MGECFLEVNFSQARKPKTSHENIAKHVLSEHSGSKMKDVPQMSFARRILVAAAPEAYSL